MNKIAGTLVPLNADSGNLCYVQTWLYGC